MYYFMLKLNNLCSFIKILILLLLFLKLVIILKQKLKKNSINYDL